MTDWVNTLCRVCEFTSADDDNNDDGKVLMCCNTSYTFEPKEKGQLSIVPKILNNITYAYTKLACNKIRNRLVSSCEHEHHIWLTHWNCTVQTN